jgi:hypothetical protein
LSQIFDKCIDIPPPVPIEQNNRDNREKDTKIIHGIIPVGINKNFYYPREKQKQQKKHAADPFPVFLPAKNNFVCSIAQRNPERI